jgi:hypothetical protein
MLGYLEFKPQLKKKKKNKSELMKSVRSQVPTSRVGIL